MPLPVNGTSRVLLGHFQAEQVCASLGMHAQAAAGVLSLAIYSPSSVNYPRGVPAVCRGVGVDPSLKSRLLLIKRANRFDLHE